MHLDKKMLHRLFLLIAGCILFAWLVLDTARATVVFTTVWDLIAPFVLGMAIAFIFNVPMRAIESQLDGIRKAGLRRGLAILLTFAALVLVIMFVIELLVPQIQATVVSLSARLPSFLERTAAQLMALMEDYPEVSQWLLDFLDLESLDWSTILRDVLTFLGNQGTAMMGSAVNVVSGVIGGAVNLVIGVVFAVYCLGRKEILARQGRRILYALVPEKTTDEIVRILRLTNATFSNFISGQCLEACILGCLFAVAMAIFGMPYIPLISVVIGVTALVPVVGAFVGCILGAVFILVDDPIQAALFVVLFLVLQQLENNLIYPRVVGTSIGLPGMWVLVAVSVGGDLRGVGGMLLMIPLVSVLYTLAREFTDKRLAQRGIPEDKLQDHPPEIQSQFKKNKERKERLRLQKMKEQFQRMQEQKKKSQ